MSEKILGIDLGTSNSAACVYIDGKATMIPSAEGTSLYGKAFPSYVSFTENGEQLVGEPAKRQATINPDNTISEIKRHMGTDYKVNIQGKEYSYFLQKNKLYRCSKEYENSIIKLLNTFKINLTKEIVFRKYEFADFYSLVMPRIKYEINLEFIVFMSLLILSGI